MKYLQENDEELYGRQFKRYIDAGIKPEGLEKLYAAAHKAIRATPNKPRGELELGFFGTRTKKKDPKATPKKYTLKKKISLEQRQGRIRQKLKAAHPELTNVHKF